MEQNKRMPVGVDDFKKVREQYYFVDKTKFIQELIDRHSDVTLITRPRRFGITLTMSMLYYFFTNENAEENRRLFDGTEIAEAGEKYMAEQGTRPVVFLTLKDVKMDTWEGCLKKVGQKMASLYNRFGILGDSNKLSAYQKRIYSGILDGNADAEALEDGNGSLFRHLSGQCRALHDAPDHRLPENGSGNFRGRSGVLHIGNSK